MGLIMGALGGMAEVGIDQIQTQRKADLQTERDAAQEESSKRLAQHNSDLEVKRQEALVALRQKTNADNAASINTEFESKNNQRIAGLINSKNGSSMTEEDAKTIASNPEAMKAYGADQTRAQEYDMKASIAESKGLIDNAKELRSQQELERQRTRDDNRDAHQTEQDKIHNKQVDNQFEWQKTQAGLTNRRLDLAEANSARRDKYQEIRDSKADDASKRNAAAIALKDVAAQSHEINAALAGGMLSPEATKLYESQKSLLDNERLRYQKQLGEMAGLKADPKADVDPKNPLGLNLPKLPKSDDTKGTATTPVIPKSSSEKYPFAGYETIDGAISGASQGNSKAIEFLRTMPQGGISIQQRTTIDKILKGR